MRLDGKVALVTGATGGMGSASARVFAREGAAVLVAARHEELAAPVVQDITDAGGRASFVSLDTTEKEQWQSAVDQAKERYGGLHILMNVVGSNDLVMLPDVDLGSLEQGVRDQRHRHHGRDADLRTADRDSGGGSIVNIGSVGGLSGTFSTAYSSSKWALEGLSCSAAYVYASDACTSARTDLSSWPCVIAAATVVSKTSSHRMILGVMTSEPRAASKPRTNMAFKKRSSSSASWPRRSRIISTRCRPVRPSSVPPRICCSNSVRMSSSSNASLVPKRAWTIALLNPARTPISAALVAS